MYVYNQVNGGSDDRGTTFADNYRVLEEQGVAEASQWTHPADDYTSQPTDAERANAAKHKLSRHTTLFLGDRQGVAARTAIMTALAANQPVALGIPVYSKFMYLNPTKSVFTAADATGSLLGAHAVAVLGYNSTGVVVENSWGTGWGKGGFATLGWDFVQRYAFQGEGTGTLTGLAGPTVTKLSAAVVSTAGGATLTITGARLPSPAAGTTSAVALVDVTDADARFPATVTSSGTGTLTVQVPALGADGRYRVVVTNDAGISSTVNDPADLVTGLHPYAVALADGSQVGRSDKATALVLTGTGFGTTSAQYTANKVTATVNGRTAPVTWVDDEHLKVTVPAAKADTDSSLVVLRSGLPSAPVTVHHLPPLPAVTKLSTTRTSTAGGTTVTVTARNLLAGDPASVTLVSTADPAVRVDVPLTGQTATTAVFTTPAQTTDGAFHVLLNTRAGTSVPVTADVLTYRTPLTGTTDVTAVSAAGGTQVAVTGSGFGATATAFSAGRVTATVAGRPAAVKWVSDTSVLVTAPAGALGTAAPIVFVHDGVPGQPITGLTYAPAVTRNATPSGPAAGYTTTLTGVGLTGSTGWALVDGAGAKVADLPVVTSTAALSSASSGVLVLSGTSAKVKLPATAAGSYRLVFTTGSTPALSTAASAVRFV
jgi:hypothetical protein